MTQESWVQFTRVAEDFVTVTLPQAAWGQLDASIKDLSVDDIWEIFIAMVQYAAKEAIPRCQVRGEPRPLKSEVPLNRGI